MNASSFNILLQGCSCTRYYIIGLANLIYQICKDNKANKHGEKNLQKPQFYFHLNSLGHESFQTSTFNVTLLDLHFKPSFHHTYSSPITVAPNKHLSTLEHHLHLVK